MIAVTGASGFIGAYLCQRLEASGIPVVGITRDGAEGTRCLGDLASTPDWAGCLQGIHTVIHCAALAHRVLQGDERQRSLIHQVNHQAVADLAQACIDIGVKRLLFLSSVKVYGESSSGRTPYSEKDQLRPEDDYGLSKALAEAALTEVAMTSNLEIGILRLPLVYGPGVKANFRKLQKLALSGLPLPLGSIHNRRSFLSVTNLGNVVTAILTRASWSFHALNVADPGPVSVADLVRWLAQAGGKRARFVPVPVGFLRRLAAVTGCNHLIEPLVGDLEISTDRLAAFLPEIRLRSVQETVLGEC